MEFAVSDHVVHPSHGTGRITGIERFDLIAGFERYYVIEITGKGLTLRVPVRKIGELGIRPIMSETKLDRVLDILQSVPNSLPLDFKIRQTGVREKIRTGRAIQIAEVVRDLIWHKELARLTKVDRDLLVQGRDMLASEMAMVIGRETAEVQELITSVLSTAIAAQSNPMVA